MMDRDDLELFERSLRAATESSTGEALDKALADLGWADALWMDEQAAIATLFTLQGEHNVSSSALEHVVTYALGLEEPTAVVLPALGSTSPTGTTGIALRSVDEALVITEAGASGTATGLQQRQISGIDPTLGWFEVSGGSVTESGPADWTPVLRLGQLAVGHELVGASRKMLALAREHAIDRVQFGQPIARFQAIRHRLAETLIAIEMADAMLAGAWEDGLPVTAAMAKGLAGRAARIAARHCQQVLAGIGFTTEHDLQRYIKRVFLLDELFGSSRVLTKQLGADVLSSGELPPLLPL
jgi:hypothetical protein